MSYQLRRSEFRLNLCVAATIVAMLFVLDVAMPAQTYQVIHNFTGGLDGANPWAGLTMDIGGNLYGVAEGGGNGSCVFYGTSGCGTAFRLTRKNGSWTFAPLYSFHGGSDGAFPVAALTIGANGSLYGTTAGGGQGTCTFYQSTGCGTVFNVKPTPTRPPTPLSPWLENVLYPFTGGTDGANPVLAISFSTKRVISMAQLRAAALPASVLFLSCRPLAAAGRKPSFTASPEVTTAAGPSVALSSIKLAIFTVQRHMVAAQDVVGPDAALSTNWRLQGRVGPRGSSTASRAAAMGHKPTEA